MDRLLLEDSSAVAPTEGTREPTKLAPLAKTTKCGTTRQRLAKLARETKLLTRTTNFAPVPRRNPSPNPTVPALRATLRTSGTRSRRVVGIALPAKLETGTLAPVPMAHMKVRTLA